MQLFILLLIVVCLAIFGWAVTELLNPQTPERPPHGRAAAPRDPYALDEDAPRVIE